MISPTRQHHTLTPARIVLLLLILCPCVGCSMTERLAVWKQPAPTTQFLITYKVKNAVHELNPWSSFADRGLESASWTTESESEPEDSAARPAALRIEFPHPLKGHDYALATLSVYDRPLEAEQFATQPKKRWYHRLVLNNYFPRRKENNEPSPSEVVTLPIPRTQFELLVDEMNQACYLDENHPSKRSLSTALLSISKNQKAIHESTVEEPRLNEVIQNVYRNGEVIVGERRHTAPSILQTSAFIQAPNPTVVD